MKLVFGVWLIAAGLTGIAASQEPAKQVMQQGMAVKMPVASAAVAMPAADEGDATVITLTADGKLFLGVQPVTVDALAGVPTSTVYVKADARAAVQQLLTVLDALQGHSVVLLTAPTAKMGAGKITPPYGVRLAVGGKGAE